MHGLTKRWAIDCLKIMLLDILKFYLEFMGPLGVDSRLFLRPRHAQQGIKLHISWHK